MKIETINTSEYTRDYTVIIVDGRPALGDNDGNYALVDPGQYFVTSDGYRYESTETKWSESHHHASCPLPDDSALTQIDADDLMWEPMAD